MHLDLITADAIERVARPLCTGRPVVLQFVSVGAYTPAVRTAETPAFVVLNLQGAPLAFAHDAFEAAVQALRLAGDRAIDREMRELGAECPEVRPTDRHLAAAASLDLVLDRDGAMARADWWVYWRRSYPKDWRWVAQLAHGMTVADLEARRSARHFDTLLAIMKPNAEALAEDSLVPPGECLAAGEMRAG